MADGMYRVEQYGSNADFESNLNRWQEAGWSIRDWRLAVYTNSDGDGYMKIIAVYSREP
jgi:hypothetical protein